MTNISKDISKDILIVNTKAYRDNETPVRFLNEAPSHIMIQGTLIDFSQNKP